MNIVNLDEQQNNFIEHLASNQKSFNTLKNYRTDLNVFKQFLQLKGRNVNLTEISNTELKEYTDYLNKKYSSSNSIRRRVQALRIFFDFLIQQGLFEENPIKKMAVQPKVVDIPRPVPFHMVRELKKDLELKFEQNSEHEKLLALRNIILFELIYGAGLKVSHIEGLKLKHILNHQDGLRVMVVPEKRDPFSIHLDESFAHHFNQYLVLLEQGKNRDQLDFDQLLFNANPYRILSGGLSARGIEIIFKEFSTQLRTTITAKNLRQACIFKWLGKNIPQGRVKEWMGVQPQYSLKPFLDLLAEKPERYSYLEF